LECGGLAPLCYRWCEIETKAAPGRRTPGRRPKLEDPKVAKEIWIDVRIDRYRCLLASAIRFFEDLIPDLRVAKHLFPSQQFGETSHSQNHECLLFIGPFLHLRIVTVFAQEFSYGMASLHGTLSTREIASNENKEPRRSFTVAHSAPPSRHVASARQQPLQSDRAACSAGYRVSATGDTKNMQVTSELSQCAHGSEKSPSKAGRKLVLYRVRSRCWLSGSSAQTKELSRAVSHFGNPANADAAVTCTIRLFETSPSWTSSRNRPVLDRAVYSETFCRLAPGKRISLPWLTCTLPPLIGEYLRRSVCTNKWLLHWWWSSVRTFLPFHGQFWVET